MDPLMPPPIRRISLDAAPTVVPEPPATNGNGHAAAALRSAPSADAIERMRCEQVTIAYGQKVAVNARRPADPPGRGARADRPLGLRQDDAAALAQPPHRADAERGARRAHLARRRRRRRARGDRAAPARVDGLPAAEPVPDVHLRQRRLRAARAARAGARARRRSRRRWSEALRRAGLWDEVAGRPRPPRAAPLRRPAAAALHRARARRAARGAADGRAVLGARPGLHHDRSRS